jgi:hypothetical protein
MIVDPRQRPVGDRPNVAAVAARSWRFSASTCASTIASRRAFGSGQSMVALRVADPSTVVEFAESSPPRARCAPPIALGEPTHVSTRSPRRGLPDPEIVEAA